MDVVPDCVEAHRFEFVAADALTDPILVLGGFGQFAEYCPGQAGCLAVEYAGNGTVLHAYPYRPEEIEKTASSSPFPTNSRSVSQCATGYLPGLDHSTPTVTCWSVSLLLGASYTDEVSPASTAMDGRDCTAGITAIMNRTSPRVTLPWFPVCGLAEGRASTVPRLYEEQGQRCLSAKIPSLISSTSLMVKDDCSRRFSYSTRCLSPHMPPYLRHSDPCNPTHVNFVHKVSGTVGGH